MALYQTLVELPDEDTGKKDFYTKGRSTKSLKTATGRLKDGMKGYVQEYNSRKIVFMKGYPDIERATA